MAIGSSVLAVGTVWRGLVERYGWLCRRGSGWRLAEWDGALGSGGVGLRRVEDGSVVLFRRCGWWLVVGGW